MFSASRLGWCAATRVSLMVKTLCILPAATQIESIRTVQYSTTLQYCKSKSNAASERASEERMTETVEKRDEEMPAYYLCVEWLFVDFLIVCPSIRTTRKQGGRSGKKRKDDGRRETRATDGEERRRACEAAHHSKKREKAPKPRAALCFFVGH